MDAARRRELRDAVRPPGDDLADPSLAPLAEELAHDEDSRRVQQKLARFDSALGRAIRNPPVPAGLHERLQAALAAAAGAPPGCVDAPPTRSSDDETLRDVPTGDLPAVAAASDDALPARRRSRRALLWPGVALAATGAAASYFYFARRDYSREGLLATGRDALGRVPFDDAGWRAIGDAERKLFGDDLERGYAVGWRAWDDFNGLSGVAFKLQGPRRLVAALFRFPEPLTLPLDFPSSPQSFEDTGGRAAAAWRKHGALYVLVINGTNQQAAAVRHFCRPRQVT